MYEFDSHRNAALLKTWIKYDVFDMHRFEYHKVVKKETYCGLMTQAIYNICREKLLDRVPVGFGSQIMKSDSTRHYICFRLYLFYVTAYVVS